MEAYDWIKWVFSGIGVLLISWIMERWMKNRSSVSQSNHSGDGSININAGGNVNAELKGMKKDAGQESE